MRFITTLLVLGVVLGVVGSIPVERNIRGKAEVFQSSNAVDISSSRSINQNFYDSKLSGIWFSWVMYGLPNVTGTYVSVLSAWDVSTGVQHLSAPIVNASGSGWAAIDVKGGRYFQLTTARDGPNQYKRYQLLTFAYKTGPASTLIPMSACELQLPQPPRGTQNLYFSDNIYSATLDKIVLQSSAEFSRYIYGTTFYLLDPKTCIVTKVPMALTDVQADKCATDASTNVWCIGRPSKQGFDPAKNPVFFSVDLVTGKNKTFELPMDQTLPGSWTLMRYFPPTNSIYYATTVHTSSYIDGLWRFDLPTADRPFGVTKIDTGRGRVSSQWFDVNTQHNWLLTTSSSTISGFDIITGNMTYNLASWSNSCPGSNGGCSSIGPAYDEFYSWNQL